MVSREDFSDIGEGRVVLILSLGEEIVKEDVEVLKILTEELNFDFCVYITTNRPYESLKRILVEEDVDVNRLYFIDCISKSVGGGVNSTPQCLYVASPSSLTELSISITDVIKSVPKGKVFLFLDSLSTLLIYNSAGSIVKFSHFLTSKVRMMGISAVFMSVEKEMDEKLINEISQFCDKTVYLYKRA